MNALINKNFNVSNAYDGLVTKLSNEDEIVGVTAKFHYQDMNEAVEKAASFVESQMNETLQNRIHQEKHYYKHIETGIYTQINEMKFMANINVTDSRRLVYVNKDCLSFIQILIRDSIEVVVQFRSSDIYGALPLDLEFISSLPLKLYKYLEDNKDFDEVTSKFLEDYRNKNVNFTINFGSLHQYKD